MSALPSVEVARARMLDSISSERFESVALAEANGRVLARTIKAGRDQPPFDASAMDGWAIRSDSKEDGPTTLRVVGESAAGRPFAGDLAEGEAVRIFTGAPIPMGSERVVPQEVATAADGWVKVGSMAGEPTYMRPRGVDFAAGQTLIDAGARLDPWRLALVASAGMAFAEVARQPCLTIISTGEEIVAPGSSANASQIFDSASTALAARVYQWGGRVLELLRIGDTREEIEGAARDAPGDLLVFIGGASVGDYDLIKPVLTGAHGLQLLVDGVNVRPGKPTWFGLLADGRRVLGLPGNPASALVCAELFLGPLLLAWQGCASEPRMIRAKLAAPLPANGPREHWMRACSTITQDGFLCVTPFGDQDSSLVTVFAKADSLLHRASRVRASAVGDLVEVLPLPRL